MIGLVSVVCYDVCVEKCLRVMLVAERYGEWEGGRAELI